MRLFCALAFLAICGSSYAGSVREMSSQEFDTLSYSSAITIPPDRSVVRQCERDLRQKKQDAWKFVGAKQAGNYSFYVFNTTPWIFDAPGYVYVYRPHRKDFLGRFALGGGARVQ
jgi:hypothetical protein